jgi:hypothetical protein
VPVNGEAANAGEGASGKAQAQATTEGPLV